MNFIEDIVIPLMEKYTQGVIDTLRVLFEYAEIDRINKGIYQRLMEEFDKNIDQVSLSYVNENDNALLKQPYKENIKQVYQELLISHINIL